MANPRPRHPICTQQIACDGDHYVKTDRGMCGKCEAALAKKQAFKKRQDKLKGERHMAYRAARGK